MYDVTFNLKIIEVIEKLAEIKRQSRYILSFSFQNFYLENKEFSNKIIKITRVYLDFRVKYLIF